MNTMKRGFTIMEVMVYASILGLLIIAIVSFLLFTVRSQAKTKAERAVAFEASRAMTIMRNEIKLATGVYAPASVFDAIPGQLSLATANVLPANETSTYVDFFQCGTQICMKRETQNPVAITSSSVQVQNFVFHIINSAGIASVQIGFTIAYATTAAKPEYRSSLAMLETVSLR